MTLEEKISQLETELKKVKAELAERKRTVWLPEEEQSYYYIDGAGFPMRETPKNHLRYSILYEYNNIFKCDDATFKHIEWYSNNVIKVQNRLMQLHELLCPDFFPDWDDIYDSAFTMYYFKRGTIWRCENCNPNRIPSVYFTKEAAEKACEILNAEKFMMGDDA